MAAKKLSGQFMAKIEHLRYASSAIQHSSALYKIKPSRIEFGIIFLTGEARWIPGEGEMDG